MKLTLREKLSYGAGGLGNAASGSMFLFFFSFYLTDVVKLAPVFVAVLQLFRNAWTALNDPLMGALTDRTRSRYGRRKPFIFIGMIPYGVAFALLWQKPATHVSWLIVGWLALMIFLYDTAASMVFVPYLALTPELTPHYDERTALNAWRQAFSMIGGLLVGGLAEHLASRFSTPSDGWGAVGWLFGALSALPFVIVLFGVKERAAPTGPPAAEPMWKMFASTFRNAPFRVALLVYLLSWVSVGIASTMFIYFLTHWMKMGGDVGLVLLAVQLTALASIPGIVWLSNRTGKRTAYVIGISFWAVIQLGLLLLRPEHGSLVVGLAALAGIGVGAAHVLPWAMIPDCIDVDELQTGERREGSYYGVMSFVEKVGTALALGGVGLVLQAYGYEGGTVHPSEAALWAVRLLMGPAPAALLVLSLVAVMFYPLNRSKHAEVRAALERRRIVQPAEVELESESAPLPATGSLTPQP